MNDDPRRLAAQLQRVSARHQLRGLLLLDKRAQAGRLRVPERDMSYDKIAWRGGRSVGGALVRRGLADWSGLTDRGEVSGPVSYWLTDLGGEVVELIKKGGGQT